MTECAVYGCDELVHAKRLCSKHDQRYRKHDDVGINYRSRMNRILVNDLSTYIPKLRTCYEAQALREMFFLGKYHGGLSINYNEAIGCD